MIKEGSVVSFEYTLSDDAGEVMESNKGEQPVTFTHGAHQIVPGLESAMLGMELNEERDIRVSPEDGYGPVNPEGFKEVSKESVPANALAVGTLLGARGPQGENFTVRVHEVKESTVVLDLNHPMAGKTLNFKIKVVGIDSVE